MFYRKAVKKIFLFPIVILFCIGLYLGFVQLTDNFHVVVEDELYRSAQLSTEDLLEYSKKYNIKTVVNLRGDNSGKKWYDEQVKKAEKLNLHLLDFKMSSKQSLDHQKAQELINLMKDAPKPILIHCRSGADRTSLVWALYLNKIKGIEKNEASKQLWMLYGRIPLWFIPQYEMYRSYNRLTDNS